MVACKQTLLPCVKPVNSRDLCAAIRPIREAPSAFVVLPTQPPADLAVQRAKSLIGRGFTAMLPSPKPRGPIRPSPAHGGELSLMISGSEQDVHNSCNAGENRRHDARRTFRYSRLLARHRFRMV